MPKINTKSTRQDILEAYEELNTLYQALCAEATAKALTVQVYTLKKINTKTTRKDILQAYEELNVLYQTLQKELAKKTPSTPTVKPVETPVQIPQIPSSTTTNKNQEAQGKMEMVIATLNALGEQFNTALSQLSTYLLVEATHLKAVCSQVDQESQRLAILYDLTIEENTLGQLLEQYTHTKKEYAEALKQQQETLENTFTEKHQAWQQEKEEIEQQLQEQQTTARKNQGREKTEYQYTVQLQRDMSKETYVQESKQQQEALKALAETHRKAWEEREKALSEREQQFKEFKEKAEQLPKELETAMKKAKEEGGGIARHQAKIKADLLAKETTGEEEIFRLKINSLNSEVTKQAEQIDKLSAQLEIAFKQTQELAVKAIEGASSHTSFQALKEIALEQAKNQPKTK